MRDMTKVVNIYPTKPIVTLNPPIRTRTMGVTKNVDEIKLCLFAAANVDEVLKSGKTVKLTLSNYDTDNSKLDIKDEQLSDEDAINAMPSTIIVPEEDIIPEPEMLSDTDNEDVLNLQENIEAFEGEKETVEEINTVSEDNTESDEDAEQIAEETEEDVEDTVFEDDTESDEDTEQIAEEDVEDTDTVSEDDTKSDEEAEDVEEVIEVPAEENKSKYSKPAAQNYNNKKKKRY